MANVLTHVFASAKVDTVDPTIVGSAKWNDGHKFTGGVNGNVLVRDTSDATYGASWASGFTYLSNVVTNTYSALAVTSTDGFVLANATPATGGATVQMSPRLRFRGTAWDTGASQTVDFFVENLPATAATPTGTLKFGYSLNGAAASYPMTLTSAGSLTTLGGISAGGNSVTGGVWIFNSAGSRLVEIADGVLQARNNAGTGFTRFILGTNDATTNGISIVVSSGRFRIERGDGGADVEATASLFTASTALQGPGTVASAGDIRLQSGATIKHTATNYAIVSTNHYNTNDLWIGDALVTTSFTTKMDAVAAPSNGTWWIESNTGAVTGASAAFLARLNGATVYVAPSVRASGRVTAQVAAVTFTTFTVGSADGSFRVSANVNVTTSTTHNFTVTCVYTDEGNTSRTLTFGFTQLTGSAFITAITNVTGAGPYESPVYHIRCKAATTITIASTGGGGFTSVTYNGEGLITQLS